MSSKSKESLFSDPESKGAFSYDSNKQEIGLQEKSTRQSHSGLIKKYQAKNEVKNGH